MAVKESKADVRLALETANECVLELTEWAELSYGLAGGGLNREMPQWPFLLTKHLERLTVAMDAVWAAAVVPDLGAGHE